MSEEAKSLLDEIASLNAKLDQVQAELDMARKLDNNPAMQLGFDLQQFQIDVMRSQLRLSELYAREPK